MPDASKVAAGPSGRRGSGAGPLIGKDLIPPPAELGRRPSLMINEGVCTRFCLTLTANALHYANDFPKLNIVQIVKFSNFTPRT